jgi:tetratricopeptide (TPR) repeat protein
MSQTTGVIASHDALGNLEAINKARQALDLHPPGDPERSLSLDNLAIALQTRCEQLGDLDALAEAVELHRQALALYPLGHPSRSSSLNNLASALQTRFQQLGDLDALTEAVELHRQALALRPQGHPNRSSSLGNLASALKTRFEQRGDQDALAEAVELHRQALALRPPGHPYRSIFLNNLANALQTRLEQLGDLDALAEAVELHRQALDLRPPGHPYRSTSLNNLANALKTRFKQLGDLDALAEAVELHRQALALHPPGHPSHSSYLNNLALALLTRFEQLGNPDVLAEAVDLLRQALALRPPGHSYRSDSLNDLACALQTRFEQLGDLDALVEAVELHCQALALRPLGHPHRSMSLNNLANALQTRFEQLGDLDALAEAVELHRQALDLKPPGHPDRSMSLSNLANALQTRFEQRGDLDALAEVVELHRRALDLRPPGHPSRSISLNNLAYALQTRFQQLGDLDALAEAVELHRQALALRPPGHPDRSMSLNNLATALQTRFQLLGNLDSHEEAVELHRQALDLTPPGHPDRSISLRNLAGALSTRSRGSSDVSKGSEVTFPTQLSLSDMDEALRLYTEGLRSCTGGHPERIQFLFDTGLFMLRPGTHVCNFEDGIRYILEALGDPASSARRALGRAREALRMIEAAYRFSTEQIAPVELSQHRHGGLVLEAYTLVIRLLPRAASLGLNHAGRLRELSGVEIISRNAATRAIAAGRDAEAVEMLEEGRGVFWSQALRLRATDLDRLPTQDAQKLRKLFQTLSSGGVRDESLGTVQRERLVEQHRRLSNAAESLIADIRSRPGMSRFLLPPAFSSLVQSLPESGFVVILVASDLDHRALVLNRAQGVVASLGIVPPEGGFFSEAVRVSLPRDGDPDTEDKNVIRLMGTSGRAKRMPKEPLDQTLAQLWLLIVKPVVDKLNLRVSQNGVSIHVYSSEDTEGVRAQASPCLVVCHRTAYVSSHSRCRHHRAWECAVRL